MQFPCEAEMKPIFFFFVSLHPFSPSQSKEVGEERSELLEKSIILKTVALATTKNLPTDS